jgi:hypothetical protein
MKAILATLFAMVASTAFAQHTVTFDIDNERLTFMIEAPSVPADLYLDERYLNSNFVERIALNRDLGLSRLEAAKLYGTLIKPDDQKFHLIEQLGYGVNIGDVILELPFADDGEIYEKIKNEEDRFMYWSQVIAQATTNLSIEKRFSDENRVYRERVLNILEKAGYAGVTAIDKFRSLLDSVNQARPYPGAGNLEEISTAYGWYNDFADLMELPELELSNDLAGAVKDSFPTLSTKISNGAKTYNKFMDIIGPVTAYIDFAEDSYDHRVATEQAEAIESLFASLIKREELKHSISVLKKTSIYQTDHVFREALATFESANTSLESLQILINEWNSQLDGSRADKFFSGAKFGQAVYAFTLKFVIPKATILSNVDKVVAFGKSVNLIATGVILGTEAIIDAQLQVRSVKDWNSIQALSFALLKDLAVRENIISSNQNNQYNDGQPVSASLLIELQNIRRAMYSISYFEVESALKTFDPSFGLIASGVDNVLSGIASVSGFFSGNPTRLEKIEIYQEWAATKLDKYADGYKATSIFNLEPDNQLVNEISIDAQLVRAVAAMDFIQSPRTVSQNITGKNSNSFCENAENLSITTIVIEPGNIQTTLTSSLGDFSFIPSKVGSHVFATTIECADKTASAVENIIVNPLLNTDTDLELNTISTNGSFKPGNDISASLGVINRGQSSEVVFVDAALESRDGVIPLGSKRLGSVGANNSYRQFKDAFRFSIPDDLSDGIYSLIFTVRSTGIDNTPANNILGKGFNIGRPVKIVENVYQFKSEAIKFRSSYRIPKNFCGARSSGGFGSWSASFVYNGRSYTEEFGLAPTSGGTEADVCVVGENRIREQQTDEARFYQDNRLLVVAGRYFDRPDSFEMSIGWPVDTQKAEIIPAEAEILVGETFTFEVHLGAKGECCVNQDWYIWEDGRYPFVADGRNQFAGQLDFDGTIKNYGYQLEVTGLQAGNYRFVTEMANRDGEDFFVFGKFKVTQPPIDSDQDGIFDLNDAFPNDIAASVDSDADGYPDRWNEGYNEQDSEEGLMLDKFPSQASYALDDDYDSVPNEIDLFPLDKNEFADSDGDGVGDNADDFPHYPGEFVDTDGDGVGDLFDTDIDNDGMSNDYEQANGLNPYVNDATLDSDGDFLLNIHEYLLGTPANQYSEFDWVNTTNDMDISIGRYIYNRNKRLMASTTLLTHKSDGFVGVVKIYVSGQLNLATEVSGVDDRGAFIVRYLANESLSSEGSSYEPFNLEFQRGRAPLHTLETYGLKLP